MDEREISVFDGGVAVDERGEIKFFNDFNMDHVKRFYMIENNDVNVIRGWRAHQIEKRWFYVLDGIFKIDLIKIDNWERPSEDLPVIRKVLSCQDNQVLFVPKGYATAFQSLKDRSKLLVFASHDISHSELDNHIWPINYFINRKP